MNAHPFAQSPHFGECNICPTCGGADAAQLCPSLFQWQERLRGANPHCPQCTSHSGDPPLDLLALLPVPLLWSWRPSVEPSIARFEFPHCTHRKSLQCLHCSSSQGSLVMSQVITTRLLYFKSYKRRQKKLVHLLFKSILPFLATSIAYLKSKEVLTRFV